MRVEAAVDREAGHERYFAMGFLFHAPTGKVLLHLRGDDAPSNPGLWHFFGGRSEAADGGDPVATWRREMREELGVDLRREHIVPLRAYEFFGRRRYTFYSPWPETRDFTVYERNAAAWYAVEEALALPNLVDRTRTDLELFAGRLRSGRAMTHIDPAGAGPPTPSP
jgi:8-oxo-dGTP pyrophosphatase MutT (NUDIX family)